MANNPRMVYGIASGCRALRLSGVDCPGGAGQAGGDECALARHSAADAQVQEHQRQLDKVRENYTYSSLETTQDIDSTARSQRPRSKRTRTSSSTAT